jgi:homoserine O-acetyltransferase/O-succinyltransferase
MRSWRGLLPDGLSMLTEFIKSSLGCATTVLGLAGLLSSAAASAADYPPQQQADYVLHNFRFSDGQTLPEVRIHYHFFGEPRRDAHGTVTNAVLIMHGTGGSGGSLIRPEFAGELFAPGQPLDATKFFVLLPDGLGHGKSSKPSDGLHARFPHYGYHDMIATEYQLLTEGLGIKHMRLIMGTSMGGMHTWLWGELHPDFMDALMPLASLPAPVSGRNRVWRRVAIDAIRNDPGWNGGDYHAEPSALRTALGLLWLQGSNPVLRQKEAPTRTDADRVLDEYIAHNAAEVDANDLVYQLDASHDYDPGPDLEKIKAPLLAINSADDLINPPELGILEREIRRVPHGRAIVIPYSEQTRGHGSHTIAVLWKQYLQELLQESSHESAARSGDRR